MNDRSALLLTGVPGIGKTTVVKCLAARLSGLSIAGFYTGEIRAGRQRVGFSLMGLCGPSGYVSPCLLARQKDRNMGFLSQSARLQEHNE